MTVILALDTSTADVCVGLAGADVGGEAWVASDMVAAGRRAAGILPVAVADVVAGAELNPGAIDGVAVGVGPGPFTSLRAGVAYALALGVALGVPVVGACSLDVSAMARRAAGEAGPIVVAADARRREVYWARYDAEGTRVQGPLVGPRDAVPQHLAGQCPPIVGPGEGTGPDAGVLAAWALGLWPWPGPSPIPPHWADPRDDGSQAGMVPLGLLVPRPLYLRRPDAQPPTVRGSQ